jgi:phage-related protein
MAYVARFTVGTTAYEFKRPVVSGDSTIYFAYGATMTPPNERLEKWQVAGVDGQYVKQNGSTPRVVRILGHIEGSSLANLATAEGAIEGLAEDQTEGTLVLWDNTRSFSNVIMTSLRWTGRFAGPGGRFCTGFEITFEVTGA